MPYKSIDELPAEQTDQYGTAGKKAFLAAFNRSSAADHDEALTFAIAHGAAKRADAGSKQGRAKGDKIAAERLAAKKVARSSGIKPLQLKPIGKQIRPPKAKDTDFRGEKDGDRF